MPTVTPQALTRTVQDFLSEAAGAVVLENGAIAFDLAQSKYSISGEYNRCLLHLWKSRMERCDWPCNGWDRRVRRNWRFAANAIDAHLRHDGLPGPHMSKSCGALWSAIFLNSKLPD